MSDSPTLRLDEDGIPILEQPVDVDAPEPAPGPDLRDPVEVERLLEQVQVRDLLDELAEDLKKRVVWKLEAALKEELSRLVDTTIQQGSESLGEEIHTRLQLALPELVARLAQKQGATESP